MQENETISFKTIRKVNEQDIPMRTSRSKSVVAYLKKISKCQIFWAQIDVGYR